MALTTREVQAVNEIWRKLMLQLSYREDAIGAQGLGDLISSASELPDQATHSGEFLTTNGTVASWGSVPDELPDQTGNAGKFLTTDGSDASWDDVPTTDIGNFVFSGDDQSIPSGTMSLKVGASTLLTATTTTGKLRSPDGNYFFQTSDSDARIQAGGNLRALYSSATAFNYWDYFALESPTDASGGQTTVDSPDLLLRAKYWSGASNNVDAEIIHDAVSAAATGTALKISVGGTVMAAFGPIADPGDAGSVAVYKSGTCNVTLGAGAETRLVADPTFNDQWLSFCLDVDGGGSLAVTFASDIDQSGNNIWTAADEGDYLHVKAAKIGGALKWRLVTNLGGALS